MLLDNKKNGKVGDELRKHLASGSKRAVISGLFSIYGFESLKKELRTIDSLHLLLSQHPHNDDDASDGFTSLAGDPFELRFKNLLNQVQIARELLLKQLDNLIKDQSPEFIYFLTLYNLFKDFLEDIDEENIIKTKTGFKETLVWNKLCKFQSDGVLGAIDKLEKYSGCIIADSVGLGKTFEALGVIKYYELRNDRVLVLCPKKLRDNWTVYTVNDKRNLLAGDRFNYDVLNHTDLTRVKGKSGEINLETLNWGNYDLVVIDESHNFRNSSSSREGLTRYSRLMDEIISSGVKTKVLMLSATPVNNRMNDLKNQVAFITEGKDAAFSEQGIASIEQTLKKAQTRFNQWLRLDEDERKVASLLDSMNFDYFKLLDISATGEENVIKQDSKGKMNDLEYHRKQLQQLQNTVVDMEEMSGGVSITDLTLNDFRMDLSSFMKEHLATLEHSPTGLYAASTMDAGLHMDELQPGVIFCLKNIGRQVHAEEGYSLAPYYLTYVTEHGDVKYGYTQSKKLLDLLKRQGLGKHAPEAEAVGRMNQTTRHGKDMSHYRTLLEKAVAGIIGKSEEKGVESLFSRGGTHLTPDSFQGMEDFEVISYLVVNRPA